MLARKPVSDCPHSKSRGFGCKAKSALALLTSFDAYNNAVRPILDHICYISQPF